MDVLFTGNLKLASERFYRKIGKEYRCVVFSEKEKIEVTAKNVVYPHGYEGDDEISHVFAAFNFETVVYFSYAIDGERKVFDELEKLENALNLSRKYNIKYFIYITSNEMPISKESNQTMESHYILREACELLCSSFSESSGITIDILKVPYIFQTKAGSCRLHSWYNTAVESGKICFPANADRMTDFLCDEDLGELIGRMLDDLGTDSLRTMEICGDNGMNFGELAKVFEELVPDVDITYIDDSSCVPIYTKDNTARKKYGWFPMHKMEEDLHIYAENCSQAKKKCHSKHNRREAYNRIKDRIYIALEVGVTFVIAEALNYAIRDNAVMSFIDFRLVGVVLMGTINGLRAGVASAILSCAGYVASNAVHTPWQILFYNIQNWLPFACYFLLGAICGYTRDKHDDAIVYAKEEYEILEDKYVFLNDLYLNVLKSKEAFNSQIIGYKDSFGKIYSVVKKLDSKLPEEVFYEAVNVLEEILKNYFVAIYSVDKSKIFARQNVCSRNCLEILPKSMKLTDYPEMLEKLNEKGTFVNREALEGYPAYASPIFRGEELVGMIMLMRVEYSEMNMEYLNKFRIITDLIKDSLIRAMEYNETNSQILKDTRILSARQFAQVLEMKKQMRKKQYLDYSLLLINQDGRSLKELNDIIAKIVRENDILGLDDNNDLYLLLSQSKKEDVDIVAARMKRSEITFTVVEA